ncbi:MAG: phospholipase D-like domain-containing protein [Desulfobacterales bacterium]|nr:phospholipase D-like domain-containing protein [Desulfobacterales bacterium]
MASDALLERIRAAAGLDPAADVSHLRSTVGSILAAVGGSLFVDEPPSAAETQALAFRLIHEALSHALSRLSRPPLNSGVVLRAAANGVFGAEAVAVPTVPVNRAKEAELKGLPVIGSVLAARIVAERKKAGPFESVSDLAGRIRGLGEQGAKELLNVLRFDDLSDVVREHLMPSDDFGANLRKLMSVQPGAAGLSALEGALEATAVTCAAERHPYEEAGLQYPLRGPDELPMAAAADARILWGSAYYSALPPYFQNASVSIDVCMFHIAMPSEAHPTRTLLEELVKAKDRGLSVRVLMDADRDSDPYLSTVINSGAIEYLKAAGVPARFDPVEKLLHSKFIVIDKRLVIIGSHNWSAGSYFQFDDLSVALASLALAEIQAARFEMLWEESI